MERNNLGRQKTWQEAAGTLLAGSAFPSFLPSKVASCLYTNTTATELYSEPD